MVNSKEEEYTLSGTAEEILAALLVDRDPIWLASVLERYCAKRAEYWESEISSLYSNAWRERGAVFTKARTTLERINERLRQAP